MRPYKVSLAIKTTNKMPWSTPTLASGKPKTRCKSPPLAAMPPRKMATGMMARPLCRAKNATRIPA
jgi:hypothetical protein